MLARATSLTLVVASLAGCTNTIHTGRGIKDPVDAFLIDHGRHASLVLQREDGRMVRYAYGDWRWYALSDESLMTGIAALFWPTPAALGRREFDAEPNAASIGAHIVEGYEEIMVVPVSEQRSLALQQKLDRIFEERYADHVYNARYDLEFVPAPDAYSFANDSNDVMGQWLEELGCDVRGPTLFSRWRVVTDLVRDEAASSASTNGQQRHGVPAGQNGIPH